MNAQTRQIILEARGQLLASLVVADSAEARLEVEVLLCHVLGLERAALYAGLTRSPDCAEVELFRSLIARRRSGEPVAYITGRRDFYGLSFLVRPGVLIPRPETELLVERALTASGKIARPAIADVGCGSGCVGIALAANLPDALVWAIDLSEDALAVTNENAARLGVAGRVTTLRGDLLAPLSAAVDLIVANLPYINIHDLTELPPSIVDFEPRLALDGGVDGLGQIRRLVDQSPPYLSPGGSLLLEVAYDQGREVAELARRRFPGANVKTWRDLGGHIRVVGVDLSAPEQNEPQSGR